MREITVHLESVSPYSQSRAQPKFEGVEKTKGETADDYEKRTWRERCHVGDDGFLFIPPMAFKMGLDDAAKRSGTKITGKGNATYTKHFLSGVIVMSGLSLRPITKDSVAGEWLYMNADGLRGGSKRVWRCYPVIREWSGIVTYHVLDEAITRDIFTATLADAGAFIGIGRFRPQKGGFYGRYRATKIAGFQGT